MIIGILSLQGDFAEHIDSLKKNGFEVMTVKSVSDLNKVDGLVMPGGESTTISKLLIKTGLFDAIRDFGSKKPVFGTCAGAILLAKKIEDKNDEEVKSLELIDIEILRNAYGRQQDSFSAIIKLDGFNIDASFIRAPRILKVHDDVEILIRYNDDPVLVREGNILVATFHPELKENAQFYTWLKKSFYESK
jgi:5'-phosphate synthase pdxT subunit